LKTLAVIIIVFLSGFNNVFSSTVPETTITLLQQGFKTDTIEESQTSYENGISYYDKGAYFCFKAHSVLSGKTI